MHIGQPRARFQQWLATYASGNPASAQALFPSEEAWQQELLEAPARSHEIVYTWNDSLVELSAAEAITISAKDKKETRVCTLETVSSYPAGKDVQAALQKKIFDLTALELRAHPSWRPVLELYRLGLTALANGHRTEAEELIARAEERRKQEVGYHQKLTDYINWFEVTKVDTGNSSGFDSYFSTAQETEQVQADPDRPNPIRADLNQVESHL